MTSAETLLLQTFAAQHPDEVARLTEQLGAPALAQVLSALAVEQAAALAVRAMPLAAALSLAGLDPQPAANILLAMEPAEATVIMLRLATEERERIYGAMPQARAAMLRTLIEYGNARAGGRVDPRVPMLPESLPVATCSAGCEPRPKVP